jgi:hypothetical protein
MRGGDFSLHLWLASVASCNRSTYQIFVFPYSGVGLRALGFSRGFRAFEGGFENSGAGGPGAPFEESRSMVSRRFARITFLIPKLVAEARLAWANDVGGGDEFWMGRAE